MQYLLRNKKDLTYTKRTFKTKRAEQRQREGLAAMEKILEDRKKANRLNKNEIN